MDTLTINVGMKALLIPVGNHANTEVGDVFSQSIMATLKTLSGVNGVFIDMKDHTEIRFRTIETDPTLIRANATNCYYKLAPLGNDVAQSIEDAKRTCMVTANTLEEKYKLALEALRYYASKTEDTFCVLCDDEYSFSTAYEGGAEVALMALNVLGECSTATDNPIVSLPTWQLRTGAIHD